MLFRSILCTDKTGTLTAGVVALNDAANPIGQSSAEVKQLAFLNASFETGIENPLDAAIVVAGTSAGLTTDGYRKIDEIPYDFLRKRLTIVMAASADASKHVIVTKGAYANVLAICSRIAQGDIGAPVTAKLRADLEAYYQARSEEGFRVLAVATRKVAAKENYVRDDEADMVFAGFLLFSDPPKPDARRTLDDLTSLGIAIKVISGDNRHVTAHVARAVGLDATAMITGEELSKLTDQALWALAPRTDLFVEVDPQQKERIVRALQKTGHAVGYLGDGINDAPALHAADVGISVDQAEIGRAHV